MLNFFANVFNVSRLKLDRFKDVKTMNERIGNISDRVIAAFGLCDEAAKHVATRDAF